MLAWWWVAVAGLVSASPQSNYNLQNLDVELEGLKDEGIPEFGTLDGVVTELGKILDYNLYSKVRFSVYFIHQTATTTVVCGPLCLHSIVLITFIIHCYRTSQNIEPNTFL